MTATAPASIRAASRSARSASLLQIEAPSPYSVSFATRTASSSSFTTTIGAMGPKTSSLNTCMFGVGRSTTQGGKNQPRLSGCGSSTTWAPLFFASLSWARRPSRMSFRAMGPRSVDSSMGSPIFISLSRARKCFVNSSATGSMTMNRLAAMQL